MKKKMHVLGYISVFLMSTGLVFKLQHWPGASIMLVIGAIIFNLVFIPMFLVSKSKSV